MTLIPRTVILRTVETAGDRRVPPTEVTSTDPKQNALEVQQQHPSAVSFRFSTHETVTIDGKVFSTVPKVDHANYFIGDEVDADSLDKMQHVPQAEREDLKWRMSVGLRFVSTHAGFRDMAKDDVAVSVLNEAIRAALQS